MTLDDINNDCVQDIIWFSNAEKTIIVFPYFINKESKVWS